MKKFLSILLSIIFGIGLLFTLLFNIVRINVTPSKIMDMGASMINSMSYVPVTNDGLYRPGSKVVKNVDYLIGGVDLDIDLNNLDIAAIVQQYVDASGYDFKIDEELIAEILSDPETKDLVDNVMNQAVDYLSGKTDTIELDTEKIEGAIVKGITIIEDKTGQTIEYDSTELKAGIKAGVEEAIPAVTESLDVVKQENSAELEAVLKLLDFLSVKYLYIFIAILAVLVILIFIINLNVFTTFRYISFPAIVVGLIFIIGSIVGEKVGLSIVIELLKDEYQSLIMPISVLIGTIIKQILLYGIYTVIPGVILCITGSVCNKNKDNKESK